MLFTLMQKQRGWPVTKCAACEGKIDLSTEWCVDRESHPICAPCTRRALQWGSASTVVFQHNLNPPIRGCTPWRLSQGVGFGLEVECEAATRTYVSPLPAAIAQSGLLPHMRSRNWWLKTDGSLSSGLEIVSQPYHVGDWLTNDSLTDWMPRFQAAGACAAGRTRCGLHIHANRGQLSHRCMQRLWFFLNRNPQFVSAISGRRTGLNKYCRPAGAEFPGLRQVIRRAKAPMSTSRYYALNLTSDETVEFRFFSGTLDPQLVKLRLTFLQLLIEYCSLRVMGLPALTVERFRGWVDSAEDSAVPEFWRRKVRAFVDRGLAKAAKAGAWGEPLPPIFNRTFAPATPVAAENGSFPPLPAVTEEEEALFEQWADEMRRDGPFCPVGSFAEWRAAREAAAVVRSRQEALSHAQAEARRQVQAEARAEAHARTQAQAEAEAQARECYIDSILLAWLVEGIDQ